MIVSLRGTHGSGKSHIVRQILQRYNAQPERTDKKGRPVNYVMQLANGSSLYVVGCYVNACGGCDSIQPYSEIWPRIERFADLGHVLFEGALVSSSYGNIGRATERYGDECVFAFLDTPLEVCLARIQARRTARGDMRPINPKNTQGKFEGIMKSLPKIRDEFRRRILILDYRKAVPQLLRLFYEDRRVAK